MLIYMFHCAENGFWWWWGCGDWILKEKWWKRGLNNDYQFNYSALELDSKTIFLSSNIDGYSC